MTAQGPVRRRWLFALALSLLLHVLVLERVDVSDARRPARPPHSLDVTLARKPPAAAPVAPGPAPAPAQAERLPPPPAKRPAPRIAIVPAAIERPSAPAPAQTAAHDTPAPEAAVPEAPAPAPPVATAAATPEAGGTAAAGPPRLQDEAAAPRADSVARVAQSAAPAVPLQDAAEPPRVVVAQAPTALTAGPQAAAPQTAPPEAVSAPAAPLAAAPEPSPPPAQTAPEPTSAPAPGAGETPTAQSPAPTAAPTPSPAPSPPPTPAPPSPTPPPGGSPAPAERPAPPAASAVARALPAGFPVRGALDFVLRVGENGLVLGRPHIEWDFGDGRYRITSTTQFTGLVGLLTNGKHVLTSIGTITADGLRPDRFEYRGRRRSDDVEVAEFAWDARRVRLSPAGAELPAPAGSQDLISFLFQFALRPPESGGVAVSVTNGRKLEVYRYEWVDEETLSLPLGKMRGVHLARLHGAREDGLDLWVAPDRFNLPLRLRYVARSGASIEMQATKLDVR